MYVLIVRVQDNVTVPDQAGLVIVHLVLLVIHNHSPRQLLPSPLKYIISIYWSIVMYLPVIQSSRDTTNKEDDDENNPTNLGSLANNMNLIRRD